MAEKKKRKKKDKQDDNARKSDLYIHDEKRLFF